MKTVRLISGKTVVVFDADTDEQATQCERDAAGASEIYPESGVDEHGEFQRVIADGKTIWEKRFR